MSCRPGIIEVPDSFACQESEKSLIDQRLIDIKSANPTFPVNQVLSTLQKKAGLKGQNVTTNDKESINQDGYGQRSSVAEEGAHTPSFISCGVRDSPMSAPPEKPHKPNRLSRTRRLKNGSDRLNDQREHFSEDVLWTDKYRPVQSSEVIGNRAAIGQLHSWLKKWKLRTNIEERATLKETVNEEQSNDCWDCGDFEDEVGAEDGIEEQLHNTVLITGPPGVGKTASVYACAAELGYKVFEVNCSSQRSGLEVLTQLKEATQSHLVETSGRDALTPAFFNSCNTVCRSAKSDTLHGRKRHKHAGYKLKDLKKATCSISKIKPVQKRSNCKKKTNPITLTSYFKTKAKADYFYHNGMSTEKSIKASTDPAPDMDQTHSLLKKKATCLILFEEVDVVFEDDVGFHAAIKTLMATTKRPVILTTTDPLFRERFNRNLDEIIFQAPTMADVCTYLQLVCLAETIQLDSNDVSALFKVTRGDVRRCLLQLQLWANSGGGRPTGNTSTDGDCSYKGCSANMLGLQSVTLNNMLQLFQEQQMNELLQTMVESWRNGFPILYSNLELLLHVDANDFPFSDLDKTVCSCPGRKMTLCDPQQNEVTSSQYTTSSAAKTKSRLSRKKTISSVTTPSQTGTKAQCSGDEMGITTNNMGSLSDFFDLMSFIDASLPLAQQSVAPCQLVDFGGTGAKVLDGQLDEMKEEEDESQEMVLDIQATLEALGFRMCKKSSQGDALLKRGPFPALSDTKNLCYITCHSCPHITVHQRWLDLSKKVLSSRYFSLLHNRRAVCIDYLPVIRFICRTQRKRQKQRPKELVWCLKTFRTQLGLAKKTVHLLASEFS